MNQGHTTLSVQRYLDTLANQPNEMPQEALVRALLGRSVDRLHLICRRLLRTKYPRLMKGPSNVESEELLGSVVERMIKAMRKVRPATVREFFALANQHLRWELNDMARRLDQRSLVVGLPDSLADKGAREEESEAAPKLRDILEAIESLADDEREAFELVRIQGMTNVEAAEVMGVSERTVHRRVARGVLHLTRQLSARGITSGSLARAGSGVE